MGDRKVRERFMGNKSEEKKIRVSLDVTPKFYNRLEQLERVVEGESKASVIRQALQLYEYLVTRHQEGATFKIVQGGEEKELAFFSFPKD